MGLGKNFKIFEIFRSLTNEFCFSEVHLDLESPKNGGLESIPAFSSPVESNGDCDKLR